MRKAKIFIHNQFAGWLIEKEQNSQYSFVYDPDCQIPISLSMPLSTKEYHFDTFPPVFDGLLPEGMQLEALLKYAKIDNDDLLTQLITVGLDLPGAITVTAEVDLP